MKLVACTLLILLGLSVWVVRAAPPDGTDLISPEHLWWECFKQPKDGVSCCSEADGHALSDHEWGIEKIGYWIKVEDKKYDVPGNTILMGDTCGPDPNQAARSEAKVWYRTIRGGQNAIQQLIVLCFMPGVEY